MRAVGDFQRQREVDPDTIEVTNAAGDRSIGLRKIRFRCGGCGRPHLTVVFPWSPIEAKYECRGCGHVSTVKTRDSAWEMVDGHLEEGQHQADMAKRTTNSRIVTRQEQAPRVAGVSSKLLEIREATK